VPVGTGSGSGLRCPVQRRSWDMDGAFMGFVVRSKTAQLWDRATLRAQDTFVKEMNGQ